MGIFFVIGVLATILSWGVVSSYEQKGEFGIPYAKLLPIGAIICTAIGFYAHYTSVTPTGEFVTKAQIYEYYTDEAFYYDVTVDVWHDDYDTYGIVNFIQPNGKVFNTETSSYERLGEKVYFFSQNEYYEDSDEHVEYYTTINRDMISISTMDNLKAMGFFNLLFYAVIFLGGIVAEYKVLNISKENPSMP